MVVTGLFAAVTAFSGPAPNAYEIGPVLRVGAVAGRAACGLHFDDDRDWDAAGSRKYGSGEGPAVAGFLSLGHRLSPAWEVHAQVSWGIAALDVSLDGGVTARTPARWVGLGAGFVVHPVTPGLVLGFSGLAAVVGPNGGGDSSVHTPTTGASPLLEGLLGYEWTTTGNRAVGAGLHGSYLVARDSEDTRWVTTQTLLGLVLFGRADL